MRIMDGSLDSRVSRRRWLQISLRTLLLLFVVCPIAAWWWWQRPYEMEVILTDPPPDRPFGHLGPWPPTDYYQREVRSVRRNQRNQPIQHGPTVAYDRNGMKIAEEHWTNGVLDGPYGRWYPDGTRQVEGHYNRGAQVYRVIYDNKGRKSHEFEYKNERIWRQTVYHAQHDLSVVKYDENEKILSHAEWTNDRTVQLRSWNHSAGKLHGTQTARHRSGSKRFENTFADGVPIGVWNWWNEAGDQTLTVEFREGRLVRIDDQSLAESPGPLDFTGANETIVARLAEITDCDFENAPLQEVVDYLSTIHEFRIGIDRRALAVDGRTADELITFKLKSVPLGPTLQILLVPRGLSYDHRFGRLWITTLANRREWTDRTGVPALLQSDDEALRDVLSSTTSLEFNDTPLNEIIESIRTNHGINIRLEKPLERELRQSPEKDRVTVVEKRVPLSVVLSILLDQLGLTCAKDGDRISVSKLTP